MRLPGLVFCLAGAVAAQTPPGALVRGTLLECAAGELSVRTASHEVFRFRFDQRTYFETEQRPVASSVLKTGELVEVVADRLPGIALRYARTVHVVEPARPVRPESLGRLRMYRSPIEHLAPLGSLTFSGVLFRVNEQRIEVHTRDGGDKTFLLRLDTRYLDGGNAVDAATLKPNMRIFVRAGKDLYGELEAYQVIWGSILQP